MSVSVNYTIAGGGGGGSSSSTTSSTEQFDTSVTYPVRMTASGIPSSLTVPCLIRSIQCIVVGTGGPVMIHDDVDAATAAQKRFSRAVADITVGGVYDLAGPDAYMAFTTGGPYFTNSTNGEYILNVVRETTP